MPIEEKSTNDAGLDGNLDGHYREVGRIAAAWADLEFALDQFVWDLADVPHTVGACITTQLTGTGPKIRAIVALAMLRGASERHVRMLNRFEGKNRPLQEQRNRIIHDWWSVSSRGIEQVRIAVKERRLFFGAEPMTARDLRKVSDDIEKHGRELYGLKRAILSELRASPEKWRSQLLSIVMEEREAAPEDKG